MDFIDILKQFSARTEKLKDQIQTEEATKTSLIMPFFQQVLGYDVFNPDEFVPEFIADVGTKKGEKVDYAIFINGNPEILVEAKWCGEPLEKHDSQLFRYFGTTNAKFAILTNGIVYKFYTDLAQQNKMDLTPFLELNILDIKEALVPELKRFCKSQFNADEIFSRASELKYSNEVKNYFSAQLKEPSDDFVKHILTFVYDGMKTQTVIDKFKPIIKNALNNYINEFMNEKITTALKTEKPSSPEVSTSPESAEVFEESKTKIITTEKELEAFYIIKGMLAETVDISRISYKDTVNYFSVLFDNSSAKWICRLRLNNAKTKNQLILLDESKREIRYEFETLNDLFTYRNLFIETVKRYIK